MCRSMQTRRISVIRGLYAALSKETPKNHRRRMKRICRVHTDFFSFDQCLRPTANRLADERTYITPSDKAGVAISISPIELVAM